jgi:DNA-binding NarL/FixJ family response regulator
MGARVLIVDDFEPFRRLARLVLESDGFEVVGEAADGPSALAEAARLTPEVVLLDIQLPGPDGFAVADWLAETGCSSTIVLISSRDARGYRRRLARSPAIGFIPKAEFSGARLSMVLE